MKHPRRFFCLLLSFVTILFLFSSCDKHNISTEGTLPRFDGNNLIPETTPQLETTEAPTAETPTTIPPTEPEHSPLYIPGVSVEDVILYYNEVCLDSEIANGGDPSYVQKWCEPIYYTLHGEYTDEDIATLTTFTVWLNSVEGFPGIYEAPSAGDANMQIHFCTQAEMIDLMGESFNQMDGAVTFWYSENIIYDSIICYRTDLDQYLRNSVILEEIYNGLGPIQDTLLRPDSIIYQNFSEPQALTPVDELILRLLYHPNILPGMNAQECEQVIRQLYY